ncbi:MULTISPECIES: hypothetical protein [Aquitalea]|uniref:hypothetical protein n=1 Tax=Aquitalea TaxID=407217 RepID=UPI00131588DD|nr:MULTISPECIES: hypothetical protein [Aquitalea]
MKSLLIGVLLASALSACVVVPPRVAYRGPEFRPVEVVPVYVPAERHHHWDRRD